MMKENSIKELVKGTHNDIQYQNNAHPKTSPIDCNGVQLANAQCHMVPVSMLWYREPWTIQFKYTFETRQERITEQYYITQHATMATTILVMYMSTRKLFRMQL